MHEDLGQWVWVAHAICMEVDYDAQQYVTWNTLICVCGGWEIWIDRRGGGRRSVMWPGSKIQSGACHCSRDKGHSRKYGEVVSDAATRHTNNVSLHH